MGEVVKKNNNAEKMLEERIMREAIAKGKQEEAEEKRKKEQAKNRDLAIKRSLDE